MPQWFSIMLAMSFGGCLGIFVACLCGMAKETDDA
jgi:uncharacterized protein involved in exopolysaccharide biosynthesis